MRHQSITFAPSRCWEHLPTPEGWKAELAMQETRSHKYSNLSLELGLNWGPYGRKAEILQLHQLCPFCNTLYHYKIYILFITCIISFEMVPATFFVTSWNNVLNTNIIRLLSVGQMKKQLICLVECI